MNDAFPESQQEAWCKLESRALHIPMDVTSSKNSDAVMTCSDADDVIKLIFQLLALNALLNLFLTWPLPIQSPRAAIQEANILASKVLT